MSDNNSLIEFGKTPSFPPIAAGDSTPWDPTAPSFLTTFPAEVRNAIYDALFHVPDGIQMAYVSQRCEFGDRELRENITAGRCEFEDRELREDLIAGLPLLATCRQIYQEAATTLFSNNTWIVFRDLCWVKDGRYQNGSIIEATGAAHMLQSFGSRKAMVKRIHLDLDRVCPVPCAIHFVYPLHSKGGVFQEDQQALAMWGLVRELTHLPDLEVEFAHPKRHAYYDLHPPNNSGLIDLGLRLDDFNTTLRTLRKDPIGIRKYGKQVEEVYVEKDCTQGHVIFHKVGSYLDMQDKVQLHFAISDGGRTLTWTRHEKIPPTFTNLFWYLRANILDHVSFPDDGLDIIWDLDRKTLTGASLIGGAICRDIRDSYHGVGWGGKRNIFRMNTNETRAEFGRFQCLKQFMRTNMRASLAPFDGIFSDWHVDFLMEFKVPSEVKPEDVRLNITNLLRVTSDMLGSGKITLSVVGEDGEPRSKMTMNLWMCRTLVLTALSEANLPIRDFHDRVVCATVWMNGRLEVVEVEKDNLSGPSEEDDYL